MSARARQLIHKMKNRRSAIIARRENEGEVKKAPLRSNGSPISPAEPNGTASRPARSIEPSQSPPMGFTAVNVRQAVPSESEKRVPEVQKSIAPPEDPFAGSSAGNVTYINGRSIKGASPTERAELMKKFMTPGERDAAAATEHARRASLSTPKTQSMINASDTRPRSDSNEQYSGSLLNQHTSTVAIPNTPASLMPATKAPFIERDDGGPFKTEMIGRMESMRRGERVMPPCDRCRRLHMDCLKNLTACMGCTKKHAKCSWRDVRPDELEGLERSTNLEPREDTEQDRETASPPSTVAELARVIGDGRSPDDNISRLPEDHRRTSDTHMQDMDAKEDSPLPLAEPAPAPLLSPRAESPLRPHSSHKFDVRPPPLGQQLLDAANRRSPPRMSPNYPTYTQKEAMRRGIAQNENDEGDRLQALAAQVYRSASQSVKPQESS